MVLILSQLIMCLHVPHLYLGPTKLSDFEFVIIKGPRNFQGFYYILKACFLLTSVAITALMLMVMLQKMSSHLSMTYKLCINMLIVFFTACFRLQNNHSTHKFK